MYSSEIQQYLSSMGYKLTLNDYNNLIDSSPQITGITLVQPFDFYFKVSVSTSDNYNWGIYVLNYNQPVNKLQEITF